MSRTIFKVEDFGPVVSAANAWESFKYHIDEAIKYHEHGALLEEIRNEVSANLFKEGHFSAAIHANCLVERLLEELALAKEEIAFLANN